MRLPLPSRLLRAAALAAPLICLSPQGFAALPTNAEVEAILNKHLISGNVVKGAAVALVDANGIRVVTAGVSRGTTPLKADDLFEIGSVTKTFAGLLLAIAEEKGELKLDDPVEKFLPEGIKLRDAAGDPIRLVDLATQRSGLPRLATNMAPKNNRNPYADYTEANLLEFLKGFKPTRKRNEQFEYSNVGFGTLGYVLVRAAKADSFETLLAERILKPLAMKNTTSDPKRFLDRLTQPHDATGRPIDAWDFALPHAATGSIRSTAGDMGLYAQAMAGLRDTPLAAAIKSAMTTREAGPNPMNPIGLAWIRIPFDSRQYLMHDGGTFGSASFLMVDRDAKEAVFIATNSSTRLNDIALHLMDRRHVIPPPREFPKAVSLSAEALARYPGTYKVNDKIDFVIRVKEGKVTAQVTGQGEFEIFPENETKFYARVAPIVITFGDIADGKAGSFQFEQAGNKTIARRVP